MDMRVNIAGVEWKNPVTVASGTFGSGAEFCDFVDLSKLGAVTTQRGGKYSMGRKSDSACGRNLRRNDECSRSAESGD